MAKNETPPPAPGKEVCALDAKTGELLGAHMIGAEVTELIGAGRGLADRTVTGIRTDLTERAARSEPARSAAAG